MTDKVNPSINRPAEAFKTAGAITLAGGAYPGYATPASSPSELSVQDSDIDETALNAFAESHSSSSFDVTIDPGEAFVYGSWCAIDTSTTVTLASSTNNQTVYVGWNKDGTNDVIIGLSSAFDSAGGNTDQKIPLWDFDTDGSGVTAATDRRQIGKITSGSVDLDGGQLTDSTQSYLDLTGDGNDLRLATGQNIQDGGGTFRIHFDSNYTAIEDETGGDTFIANSGSYTSVRAFDNQPFIIEDNTGNFYGVTYNTSASAPGTLELTNAELTNPNGIIIGGPTGASWSPSTVVFSLGDYTSMEFLSNMYVAPHNSGSSKDLIFKSGSNYGNVALNGKQGELMGTDDAGNQTTLT